jgi:DUF4097 and DUF4098 domain-containing protein YvlB
MNLLSPAFGGRLNSQTGNLIFVMKTSRRSPSVSLGRLGLALCCFAGLALQAETTESNLNKVFSVSPGGLLRVDADRGSITISTTEDRNEVAIEVLRKVKGVSSAKGQEVLAAHEVNINQDGDRVEVLARFKPGLRDQFNRATSQFQVEYRIAVPRRYSLDLLTSAGAITCGDLEGVAKVKTAGGSLKFGRITGSFEGTTSAGGITLEAVTGLVTAKTSSGSIHLGEMGSDTVAETSAGSIRVDAAKAKLVAKTAGGSIEAGHLTGPAELDTSAGSIKVKLAAAALSVRTSGGGITIEEARDTVTAQTSAGSVSVGFTAQPPGDCRLTTAGGGVKVEIAPGIGFDVDARTVGGRVTTELPIVATVVGEHHADRLLGKLNGGGKALVLKTSAGNITIQGRRP